jgi:CRISPR-associated protein Cmr1
MPSISFELETITPLFLGGAEQTEAELRPPAFRGVLRYWFRAMAASLVSLNKVKEWENKIFGTTDAGGKVIIRVQAEEFVSTKFMKRDRELNGINYLFFSMYQSGDKEAKGCFPPESKFKLILQTRTSQAEDLNCLKLAFGAMWLLINLGGIGARSNRGAGSLSLNKEPKSERINLPSLNFKLLVDEFEDLKNNLTQRIKAIRELYRTIIGQENITLTTTTEFDILHPETCFIYLWQSENIEYWDDILDDFGLEYQQFRRRYQDDYNQVKQWIKTTGNSRVDTVERAAFGLPIEFYFTSLERPNNTASLKATNGINRSSSPFKIKLLPIGDDTYTIVLLHFKTKLLSGDARLYLKNKNNNTSCKVPTDQAIIQEFISKLTTTRVNI